MSLHYLLDGYNIIHQLPGNVNSNSLEMLRDKLIHLVMTQHPHGSARNKMTVVFDGQPGYASPAVNAEVQVIFSYEESADDKIKKMVEHSANSRQMVVVTDDREIQTAVKSMGASVVSVNDFLWKGQQNMKSAKQRVGVIQGSIDKRLSSSQERKITGEFEKIWGIKDR
ncbi:MAG: NYN domain-containing protein [Candidatus Omnitrophica bacterium]|nr:NYN domain-containing protein [Candidatus Omnitrophota bacterium]